MTKNNTTDYNTILLERLGTEERLARITLNRPDSMNSLSYELWGELSECLHDLEADHSCRVIILRGAGKCFSAGHDLADRSGTRSYKRFVDQGRPLLMNTRTMMQQVTDHYMYYWNMAKITIAQIHGSALAGGCEFAMMSDLVVSSDNAKIGHPGHRGLGTARNGNIWPLVMGMRKAKEYYYTGDTMSGKEAADAGMINYAWPEEDLERFTLQLAERIANGSADHLAMLKLTMNRFYENMGIYSSVRSATEQDAMAQMTGWAYDVRDIFEENGLREGFRVRDAPYKGNEEFRSKKS